MMEWLSTYSAAQQMLKHPLPSFALLALLGILAFLSWRPSAKDPPYIKETIPFVSTTYLFLMEKAKFLETTTQALRKSAVVQFWLGPKRVYVVAGSQNVQAIFKSPPAIRDEIMMEIIMGTMWAMPKNELEIFLRDQSGRGRMPAPGTEHTPENERHWAINHHLYDKYLTSKKYSDLMALKYCKTFSRRLETYQVGEWCTLNLFSMLKQDMTKSATEALIGPRVLEMNPDFIKAFWELDEAAFQIALGPPRWLNPRPWRLREEFHAMVAKWVEYAWANFDWDGPDQEADWEGLFGARISRELARWLRSNFCLQTQAGFFASLLFGQNSNTLPSATWAMIELLKNPELFKSVKEECLSAYTTDPQSGARTIDVSTVLKLPLLQSVYTETMRLHVSMSIMREVVRPMTLNGYELKKNSLMLVPNSIAHCDETSWSVDKHPASEFWAGRHVKYVERIDKDGNAVREPQFVLGGRPSSFFPFGGGVGICPGRNFAKQEILITLAILIARFDIEFVEWTHLDGTASDREPHDNPLYAGAGAMPPDRDIKIRWKRLW